MTSTVSVPSNSSLLWQWTLRSKMDDDIELEGLRRFVSDKIFQFLTSTSMDSDPTSNLDDPSTSHASIDLLDAQVDALLRASSQQFEETLEPNTKCQRLDTSLQTATKKWISLYPRQRKKLQKPSLELFQLRHLQTIAIALECGENGETTDLLCMATTCPLWTGSKSMQFHLWSQEEKWWKISSQHTPPHCVWNPVACSNECQQHYRLY